MIRSAALVRRAADAYQRRFLFSLERKSPCIIHLLLDDEAAGEAHGLS
jgi:hypothetical protein